MDDTRWIGEIYTSHFGWNVLEDIVDMGPRLGASVGEEKAQARVKEAFAEAGLRDIEDHAFEAAAWERGSSQLTIDQPVDFDCETIALPGSPAADVTGEVVHLGYGLPRDFERADVEGKIVVVTSDVPDWYEHWMHRREKYGLAIEGGADAFVYANHVEGTLAPTGSLAGGTEMLGGLPAVGVSKEVGARLKRYARKGDVTGHLEIDVDIDEDGSSQNVTGLLGPENDKEIIVGAHVDGHDISDAAMDNGAGVAILCEVARALGQREDQLDTRVRFIGFGCEEFGLVGSQFWADDHETDKVRAVVNLDGIGSGRNQKIYTHGFDDFEPVIDRVAEQFDHPVAAVPEYVLHSDHWPFVWRGVPGVMVTADSGTAGRGFGHTTADTLEKVDIRELREHAILASRLVEHLADAECFITRKTADQVEEHLRQTGRYEELVRAGDWPY